MRYTIAFLLLVLLGACSTMSPEKKMFIQRMDKWVGHPFDDLVYANGTPTEVYLLDSGGKELEYSKRQLIPIDDPLWAQENAKQYAQTSKSPTAAGPTKAVPKRIEDPLFINPPNLPAFAQDELLRLNPTINLTRQKATRDKSPCIVLFKVGPDSKITSWSMDGDCD